LRRSNPSWLSSPVVRHNIGRDLGPAIAEGRPFADDLTRCEVKWLRLMAGARFTDVRCVPAVLVYYEPRLDGGREIARI
jgi:hypothetical protein